MGKFDRIWSLLRSNSYEINHNWTKIGLNLTLEFELLSSKIRHSNQFVRAYLAVHCYCLKASLLRMFEQTYISYSIFKMTMIN